MGLISIIVPVYNVEKYLTTCVESILNQTDGEFELLLIDDGSKDASGKICDEYGLKDQRVKVFHKKNSGVSDTRNFGMSHAKGSWVLFVDSDDWISKYSLEICRKYLNNENDICFIGNRMVHDENVEDRKLETVPVQIIEREQFRDFQFRIFNRDRFACCDRNLIKVSSPCKFYRNEFLKENKIKFPNNLVNGEDGILNLYAYQYAHRGICVEIPLYFYRQRSDSVTKRYTQEIEKDFNKLHSAYKNFIRKEKLEKEFGEVYNERIIWSLGFYCLAKYCHKDNKDSYREKKKSFIEQAELEKESIEKVDLSNFGKKKAILFWFIKKRFFAGVLLLCKLEELKESKMG